MKTLTTFLLALLTVAAFAGERLLDEKMAAKAAVVLRVRRLSPEGGSKYAWFQVQVLEVLKNESGETFGKALSVAAYSWKEGVPEGESTLYLERYNPEKKGLWKLVGGEASTGVSHAGRR
ncbi:hypothetical protein [Prosthecobacter sp.]|uniref:hypothetical protein n=1 Tax=Prosthecobacter sp. TaxID=1965333 RepID=UPI003784794B